MFPITFEPETDVIFASVIAPSATFAVVTAATASFPVVTAPSAIFAVLTAAEAIVGAAAVPVKSPANCTKPFVFASASGGVTPTGIVMFVVPSNRIPLMVRGVSNAVALAAKLALFACCASTAFRLSI